LEGNFCEDPDFCDRENGDYHLWIYSPCARYGLVGALSVGCWDQAVDGSSEGASSSGQRMLAHGAPNPFSSSTRIRYTIPDGITARPVAIEICEARECF
jgi:hypothetical protein